MFHDTPLRMVEDAASLAKMVEELSAASVIGVDTESDSFHHYREKVCLLQLSDLHTDYIVDPLSIPDLAPLASIMADPKIVKIFHGADYDVVCLKRDFGFAIVNIFDTMIAAQVLGFAKVGLADLINRFFGHEIDKQYQRHDWAQRPLLEEHLWYARGDTHFLLAIRELLTWRLNKVDRLGHLEEECRILQSREWEGRTFDPDGYLRIKGASALDDTGKRVLRRLYLFRNKAAEQLDRPPFKVVSDKLLLNIAHNPPRDARALDEMFPRKMAMKRRFGNEILEAVLAGLEDDFEIPKAKPVSRRSNRGPRLTGRAAERTFNDLKNWRNDLIDAHARLSPVTVASNNVLKAIAQARPATLDELAQLPDVRDWQVADWGEQILEIVARVSADDSDDAPSSPRSRGPRRRRRRRGGNNDTASAS